MTWKFSAAALEVPEMLCLYISRGLETANRCRIKRGLADQVRSTTYQVAYTHVVLFSVYPITMHNSLYFH